jgi:hypothetical protein
MANRTSGPYSDHRALPDRLLHDAHTQRAQPFDLRADVGDGERGVRDVVGHQRGLERFRGRMGVGLEQ